MTKLHYRSQLSKILTQNLLHVAQISSERLRLI